MDKIVCVATSSHLQPNYYVILQAVLTLREVPRPALMFCQDGRPAGDKCMNLEQISATTHTLECIKHTRDMVGRLQRTEWTMTYRLERSRVWAEATVMAQPRGEHPRGTIPSWLASAPSHSPSSRPPWYVSKSLCFAIYISADCTAMLLV